jgi:hypothetical protein
MLMFNQLHVAVAVSLFRSYSRSPGQEILHLLQNPKINYRARKSPLPDHIPSQMNPANTLPNYFFNMHVSIEDPILFQVSQMISSF